MQHVLVNMKGEGEEIFSLIEESWCVHVRKKDIVRSTLNLFVVVLVRDLADR